MKVYSNNLRNFDTFSVKKVKAKYKDRDILNQAFSVKKVKAKYKERD